MNNLKSKIISYKILKKLFSAICVFGILGFIFFSLGENINVLRNGWISITFMLFGIIGAKYSDFKIRICKEEYFSFKKHSQTQNKIIEFEKIA